MEHLFTALDSTTALKPQNFYWNSVQKLKSNENNGTPLHGASSNNSTETTKLLLERSAEREARDVKNGTPLHDAAMKNRNGKEWN